MLIGPGRFGGAGVRAGLAPQAQAAREGACPLICLARTGAVINAPPLKYFQIILCVLKILPN